MTNEEALKHFKSLQKRYTTQHNGVMCEKVKIAIEAIEKQISKKPKLWHNQPYPPEWADDDWGYRCPTCGNEDIDYPEHHCSCGQALDWGDIK